MHSGSLLSCDLLGDELCDCRRSIAGCAEKRLEVRRSDIVGDLLKVDGVELALGGADAAAHAQALVNNGCAAAEAAGGLYLHLLLGEGTTQILEGLLCFLGRAVGGMLSGSGVEARNGNACGGGVHRLIIASVTADDLRLTGMYIAVDGDRALFACRDIERG